MLIYKFLIWLSVFLGSFKLQSQTYYFIYEYTITDTFFTKLPPVYKHLLPPGSDVFPIPFSFSIYEYYVSDGSHSYKYNQSIEKRFMSNPDFYKFSNRGGVKPMEYNNPGIIDLNNKKWLNTKGEMYRIPEITPLKSYSVSSNKLMHEMMDGIYLIEDLTLPRPVSPLPYMNKIYHGISEIKIKSVSILLRIFELDHKKFTFPKLSNYMKKLEESNPQFFRIPYYLENTYSNEMRMNPPMLKLPDSQ